MQYKLFIIETTIITLLLVTFNNITEGWSFGKKSILKQSNLLFCIFNN